mgnify:CR=1 FL=1
MSELYDFILFENFHQAQNHKIDLVLIARMLQSQGQKVAILNIYGEDNSKEIDGIEIINLPFKATPPQYHKIKLIGKIEFLIWQRRYFKKVIKYIAPLAKNFYFGSYHVQMPTELFKIKKPCFYWGLRSSRMTNFARMFKKQDFINVLHAIKQRNLFIKNPKQCLFVSNEIIEKEFENLGINANRLVIREERCIEQNTRCNADKCSPRPLFLVIGQLRKQKNLPITIEAFKLANIPDAKLCLIGRSQDKYEKEITATINNDDRIERNNSFLEYDDFLNYYTNAHFVLFADEQGDSCITNGTFTEALIQHRPVVAPDYNPYSYYINKYGLGILYKPKDIDSYANAMKQAVEFGVEYFQENIEKFLKGITFERVANKLVEDIKEKMSKF